MKWYLPSLAVIMLILSGALVAGVRAQEEATDQTSELTLPWDEFKKLVRLDEDEIIITLETFEKLLAQTGVTTTPPHTVREGNVVLSRAEFDKLVDQMLPPEAPEAKPPFDYLMTKALYSGKMQDDNTMFTGTFTVHVLKRDAYLKVPLLPQTVALADVKVDGESALVVRENGYQNVVLRQPGEYEVAASFSIRSSLDTGPHKIDLAIQETPITLFRLEMPLTDIDVEIPQAQQILTTPAANRTVVSAVISPGYAISVRWRKKVEVVEKLPPKLYGEVYHLVSIEDDALKIDSDINYNILHSEVDVVRLAIPDNMNVLSVSGEGVGEWQEVAQEGERVILAPFTYGQKGHVTVRISSEIPLSEGGMTNAFSGIRVLDTVRETGFIGIQLSTSAEVVVAESAGLEPVAVQKLPPRLINKSAKPLMFGFKYLRHPYSLVLDIKKHEKIPVPVATIHSANTVTLFTEDGKVVHRLVYQIRNSAKQFLEIQLPAKADVWTVLVDNQPVESSINAHGKLLVPLIRSRSTNNRLEAFPVEVIYCLVEDRFSWLGWRRSSLPAVDLLVSQSMWSVYLPYDYSYHYFASTLEKEELIRGLNILAGARRDYDESAVRAFSQLAPAAPEDRRRAVLEQVYRDKEYKSKFRNIPMPVEQMTDQLSAELEFAGRLEGLAGEEIPRTSVAGGFATGVLPIQIEIPTGGQVYRFARTIVRPEDPLTIRVLYSRSWVGRAVTWVLVLAVLLLLYLNRRKLAGLKPVGRALVGFYGSHRGAFEKAIRSPVVPFAMFGLLIVSVPFSRFFVAVFFLLFWVSTAYQVILYRRRRAQAKAKARARKEKLGSADE
jgi:hypothetical protein